MAGERASERAGERAEERRAGGGRAAAPAVEEVEVVEMHDDAGRRRRERGSCPELRSVTHESWVMSCFDLDVGRVAPPRPLAPRSCLFAGDRLLPAPRGSLGRLSEPRGAGEAGARSGGAWPARAASGRASTSTSTRYPHATLCAFSYCVLGSPCARARRAHPQLFASALCPYSRSLYETVQATRRYLQAYRVQVRVPSTSTAGQVGASSVLPSLPAPARARRNGQQLLPGLATGRAAPAPMPP